MFPWNMQHTECNFTTIKEEITKLHWKVKIKRKQNKVWDWFWNKIWMSNYTHTCMYNVLMCVCQINTLPIDEKAIVPFCGGWPLTTIILYAIQWSLNDGKKKYKN